jgi:hypothetical protein
MVSARPHILEMIASATTFNGLSAYSLLNVDVLGKVRCAKP